MGLDITAYSKLERIDDAEVEQALREDPNEFIDGGAIHVDLARAFPDHIEGIAIGWYRETSESKHVAFSAGSYGGYEAWRDRLS